MAKRKVYYTVVKLAPNVSSWCDMKNSIYLSRPNKMSKRLKKDCDMEMINKGVEAGLIKLQTCFEEVEIIVPKQKRQKPVEKVEEPKEESKAASESHMPSGQVEEIKNKDVEEDK